MRAIIVGCGRVGSGLAERLARAGHDVTIIDVSGDAFKRLEPDYPGKAVRGDGTDEDVLRRAGTEGADYFFGLTEGDNRNILTAQLAAESLGVTNVVAKVNDPVRSEAYRSLGISTICRTTMLVDALGQYVGLPGDPGAMAVSAATGQHPGGGHDEEAGAVHAAPDAQPVRAGAITATGADRQPARAPAASVPLGRPAADAAAPVSDAAGAGTSGRGTDATGTDASGRSEIDVDGRGRRAWKLLRRTGERDAEG